MIIVKEEMQSHGIRKAPNRFRPVKNRKKPEKTPEKKPSKCPKLDANVKTKY